MHIISNVVGFHIIEDRDVLTVKDVKDALASIDPHGVYDVNKYTLGGFDHFYVRYVTCTDAEPKKMVDKVNC
jgi:hypothetical protein